MNDTVVVTGLPRTCTSAVMGALAAGGFPVFYDDFMLADAKNPGGYYQHSLAQDPLSPELLTLGRQAVKILFPCVRKLPTGRWRFVVCVRDPTAQIESLRSLVRHQGGEPPLAETVERAMFNMWNASWARLAEEVYVEIVRQEELLEDPAVIVARLADFIGGLDVAAAVEYLNRHRPEKANA